MGKLASSTHHASDANKICKLMQKTITTE